MKQLNKLIDKLLSDSEIAMVPHNNDASDELKQLFKLFTDTSKDALYRLLMKRSFETIDHETRAVNTIKFYKGEFSFFDTSIDFNTFQKIKLWLDKDSLKVFELKFFREYAEICLNSDNYTIHDDLLELIISNDLNLYIQIAKKLNIKNAVVNIFNKDNFLVFDWLNTSKNMYSDLVLLNQDKFILENMNGRLDITLDSIKYIIEKSEASFDLYVAIKRKIGLEKLWELSKHRFENEFFVDIVETWDEFLFVLNIKSLSLNSLETILDKMKSKFPHIYENFNSLLFVKKGIQ